MANIWDVDKPLRNVWRSYVTVPNGYSDDLELILFVEAADKEQAHEHTRRIVTAIFPVLTPEQLLDAYYNLTSAKELINDGMSENPAFRLFETAWSDRVLSWVQDPIFAVRQPSALFSVWREATAHFRLQEYLPREAAN